MSHGARSVVEIASDDNNRVRNVSINAKRVPMEIASRDTWRRY